MKIDLGLSGAAGGGGYHQWDIPKDDMVLFLKVGEMPPYTDSLNLLNFLLSSLM